MSRLLMKKASPSMATRLLMGPLFPVCVFSFLVFQARLLFGECR